jgi:hypothetical protein
LFSLSIAFSFSPGLSRTVDSIQAISVERHDPLFNMSYWPLDFAGDRLGRKIPVLKDCHGFLPKLLVVGGSPLIKNVFIDVSDESNPPTLHTTVEAD